MENILLILSSGVAIKLLDILWEWVKHKRGKSDSDADKFAAIRAGLKATLRDRIRYLCKRYITDGGIDPDDHEDLVEMHTAYHNLGGNGHLDNMMAKVNKLEYRK